MVVDVLAGIVQKLTEKFGDEYGFYGETEMPQDAARPCFFIRVLNPSQSRQNLRQYSRKQPFEILYYPVEENSYIELYTVGTKLFEILEQIVLSSGDLLSGTAMSYEVVERVLHFKVNYDVILEKVRSDEAMTTLDVDTKINP